MKSGHNITTAPVLSAGSSRSSSTPERQRGAASPGGKEGGLLTCFSRVVLVCLWWGFGWVFLMGARAPATSKQALVRPRSKLKDA